MDETPILKAYVQSSEVPVRSVGIFIGGQGTRNFALVSKVTEALGSLVTFHIMKEAAHVFRGDWVWVVRGTEGWRANVRDGNGDFD